MTEEISLQKWLVDRGYTPQQAELWCDFISDAFELIDDGHTLLCTPHEWSSFLAGCHAEKPTEPEVTSGLGDRMKRLQFDAPIESDRDKLHVGYEEPPIGDQSHGIRKPKVDFVIRKKFEAGYSASFAIEAKPLRTPADMNSRYLGVEGIGCFLERDPPYSRDIIVGMMGYAFKDHAQWVPLLAKKIRTSGSLNGLAVILLPNGRKCHVSEHERGTLNLPCVTVTHTILNYS